MPKLNDTLIRNTKPKAKAFKLFDGDGLYLEIATSGGKWWRLKYRFNGKEKRLSLGVYPDTTLKEAREHCHEARKLLNNGIDPSENRKVTKAAKIKTLENNFEAVAREWFGKYSKDWTPKHRNGVIRRFEHILPSGFE